jgi:hypothetical protein
MNKITNKTNTEGKMGRSSCGFVIANQKRKERREFIQALCKCTTFKKGKNKKEKVCIYCGAVWNVFEPTK